MSLRVLIVGGGIGGLCLAQGLRKHGIDVAVYERDASPTIRRQGYRLNINAYGGFGLRECLPDHLYELYLATSSKTHNTKVVKFDCQLNEIDSIDFGITDLDPAHSHSAVNRLTLRQILLSGLEEVVHFNCTLVAVELFGSRVQARFADGSTVEGDVLIAADGINSVVRRQMLPDAEVVDMNLRSIYGKTPLDEELLKRIPAKLFNAINTIIGPNRHTLVLGFYQSRRPHKQAAAELAPGVMLDSVEDYLMWGMVAPSQDYPVSEEEMLSADSSTLHRFVLDMTKDWHPDLRRLIEHADVPSSFALSMRTSRPLPPWQTTNITLLGDAIHAMSPAGGSGASIALLDAALLTQLLNAVNQGEMELLTAISTYETKMREYSFTVVEQSLQIANEVFFRTSDKESSI